MWWAGCGREWAAPPASPAYPFAAPDTRPPAEGRPLSSSGMSPQRLLAGAPNALATVREAIQSASRAGRFEETTRTVVAEAVEAACRVRRGRCSIPPEIVQPEPGDHAAVADERLELGVVGLAVGRRRAWLDTLLLAQPAEDGIDGFDDALGGLRRPGIDRNELSGQRTRTIIAVEAGQDHLVVRMKHTQRRQDDAGQLLMVLQRNRDVQLMAAPVRGLHQRFGKRQKDLVFIVRLPIEMTGRRRSRHRCTSPANEATRLRTTSSASWRCRPAGQA